MRPKRPSPEVLEHYRQLLISRQITRREMAARFDVAEFTTFRWLGSVRNIQQEQPKVVSADDRARGIRQRELAKRERLRRELGQYLLINNQVKSIIG